MVLEVAVVEWKWKCKEGGTDGNVDRCEEKREEREVGLSASTSLSKSSLSAIASASDDQRRSR